MRQNWLKCFSHRGTCTVPVPWQGPVSVQFAGNNNREEFLPFDTTLLGSCVLKASVDRVSVDTIGRYVDRQLANISTNTRLVCRPWLDRVSVDMILELIDCRLTLLVGMSVDTRLTPRPICCNQDSLVYRSTVSSVSVNCRWYRSFVHCFFAEIAAFSCPQVTRKKSPAPMLVCW